MVTPWVRMHDDEVEVTDDLVRLLIDEQAPQLGHGRQLRRLPSTGTDNALYRLGHDLTVRLPRIHWAEPQIAKEATWLPRLAPQLPVAVPAPVAVGRPDHGYPFRWLVSTWLPGTDALAADAWTPELAVDVAAFVRALHAVELPDRGPAPGRRGRNLPRPGSEHDVAVRRMIAEVEPAALAAWEEALAADRRPEATRVWVHGDLLPGNLVVDDATRRLAGVIDWSAAGVGDPACDTMLGWALPAEARLAYRQALGLDDAAWARGRGWTIEQAVAFIPYYERTIPDGVAAARRRLRAVLDDLG